MAGFVKVATLDQVTPGERMLCFVDEQAVVLFNIDGQIYCIADICTHDGGPLGDGELYGHEIECPRHGATFDIRTGAAILFPATVPVPIYSVRIEKDEIQVAPG